MNGSSSTPELTRRLDATGAAERQQAARALLMHPLLSASEFPDELLLVRRHAAWLREWFQRQAGWHLHVDAAWARLRKTPATLTDGTRPALGRKEQPFTRRRYAIFCLALAALERADRQTALGRLAEQVLSLVKEEPAFAEAGLEFNLDHQDQRRDMVQAVSLLMRLGVLTRVQGDEQAFIENRAQDVLYNVNRGPLAAVLDVRTPPAQVPHAGFEDRLAALHPPVPLDTDEARNRTRRVSLMRRLLDDPVIYFSELSPDELEYLHSQRAMLLRQAEEATGLHAEVRAEGIALVCEDEELTDRPLPADNTEGHLALLLAAHAAEWQRKAPGTVMGQATLLQRTRALIREFGPHWRKEAAETGMDEVLLARALDHLEALRLVRRLPDGVQPLPAIGRFKDPSIRAPRKATP